MTFRLIFLLRSLTLVPSDSPLAELQLALGLAELSPSPLSFDRDLLLPSPLGPSSSGLRPSQRQSINLRKSETDDAHPPVMK